MLKLFRIPYLILIIFGTTILAMSVSTVVAAATSRAYKSQQTLAPGTMVSLDTGNAGNVVAATPDNASRLVGVVVPDASATLQFDVPGAQNQVAESGEAQVLVSDLNGTIKTGDHIVVSPVEGVGMKAVLSSFSIGIARADFKIAGAVTKTITDKAGRPHDIHISQIKIILGVGQFAPVRADSYIPSQLQTLADTINGGPTAAWRILSGSAIILVTLIVIGAIVYSSIRSSLISIGRNPLSSPAIYRSLFQLVVMVVGLLFLALLGVYLVLTR